MTRLANRHIALAKSRSDDNTKSSKEWLKLDAKRTWLSRTKPQASDTSRSGSRAAIAAYRGSPRRLGRAPGGRYLQGRALYGLIAKLYLVGRLRQASILNSLQPMSPRQGDCSP